MKNFTFVQFINKKTYRAIFAEYHSAMFPRS